MKIQKRAFICLCASALIMAFALVMSLCGHGINYGIDFAGGLNIQYDMGASFAQADVETALQNQGITEYTVSNSGDGGRIAQIRIPTLSSDEEIQNLQASLEAELSAIYPDMDTDNATASYVGPVAGKTLVKNAVWSVVLASVLMLLYIAVRFDLASGLAAVIGLLHDVFIMLSFMVILRSFVQMNSSFIAAMLTIVGYSINNTIVIFDRIRENKKKMDTADRDMVASVSVKECLGRTVNTTVTTLITLVALYVFGVESIREFGFPLIIGMLAGTYSSVLLSGQVWAIWSEKFASKKAETTAEAPAAEETTEQPASKPAAQAKPAQKYFKKKKVEEE